MNTAHWAAASVATAAVLGAVPALAQVSGPTPGSSISTSASITEQIVFTAPVVTVRRIDIVSTQIIGRLQGGTIFDQSYPVPFADPAAQAGLASARMAITTHGGPGVVINAPVRTQRTETLTSSVASRFTLNRTDEATTVDFQSGPSTLQVGGFYVFRPNDVQGPCSAAIAALPATTRPVCGPDTRTPFNIVAGTANINTLLTRTFFVDETRDQTDTNRIFEQYELNGTVVAIGTVHAAVQSGLFDRGGWLLGRMGAGDAGLWGEAHAMRVRHGDQRSSWGLAAGYGFAAGSGLTLSIGVDHGRTDIDVPGALESGRFDLTEVGVSAHYERGGFSASLTGVHGFGKANTLRTIAGTSSARYDVSLTGVAFEFGYAVDAGGLTLRPVAAFDHVVARNGTFTESDTLGLIARGHSVTRSRASAGLETATNAGAVRLSVAARYVAILDGRTRTLPVAFAIAPTTPLVMSGEREPDSVQVDAGARLTLGPGATLAFAYQRRFGGGYTAQTALVRLVAGF